MCYNPVDLHGLLQGYLYLSRMQNVMQPYLKINFIVDEIIWVHHYGFWSSKSARHHAFYIHKILEKKVEYSENTY
jgi:hypothetical protein